MQIMRVRVYRNLNRNCWSVLAAEGPRRGRLIKHVTELALRDCRFVVSEAGRLRVLREKRKNVHAYVEGEWMQRDLKRRMADWTVLGTVSYNPYARGTFLFRQFESFSSEPITVADGLRMFHDPETGNACCRVFRL